MNIGVEDIFQWILSTEYTWENLLLAVEYSRNTVDTSLQYLGPGNRKSDAFYVMANYRFTDWFELGSYYSMSWADLNDRDGDDIAAAGGNDWEAWQQDIALTGRFDLSDSWVAKLEVHYIDGTGDMLRTLNPANEKERDAFLFAAKVSYTF